MVESSSAKAPPMDEAARKEAREFMRRQREKRKLETAKKEVDKSFVIKQRLDELRKTTRNVITAAKSKNKSQIKISPPRDFTFNYRDVKEIKVLKLKPLTGKISKIPEPRSPARDPVEKESFEASPLSSPRKAWGGIKPAIKPSSPIKKGPLQLQNQVDSTARPPISLKPARATSKENKKPLDDMKLKVPDVKLSISKLSQAELAPSAYQSFVQPNSTVPFWLQNSGVQPYPYNFIWAVRKKLEAHTNAVEAAKVRKQQLAETPHLRKQRTGRKGRKLPDFIKHQNDESVVDLQKPTVDEESETNLTSLEQEANTISDISSIISDLALVKSKSQEKEPKTDDDDTTISESIFHSMKDDAFVGKNRESVNSEFSRSSFEKNVIALAPENVSPNTSAKRSNFLSSTMKNISVEMPKLKSPSFEKNDEENNKINQEKELEYQKMLQAFQQSLSSVIEVNQKLFSSKSSVTSSKSGTVKNYSSSFENNVESEVAKTSGESKIIDNLVQRLPPPAEPHSESNSSIKTFIDESSTKPEPPASVIEDPPIIVSELPQEPSSSTLTSTTQTKVVQPQLKSADSKKEELENTLNESKLLNAFGYSESETSFNIADNNASFGLVSRRMKSRKQNMTFFNFLLQLMEKSSSEIKSWERSLIDRTRGQIAWLELQKQNFRKHGQVEKASSIKKRQRAILLRLEKERQRLKESAAGKEAAPEEASLDVTANESEARENIER